GPLLLYVLEQPGREVQAGGGRGDAALVGGVNGLVAVVIGGCRRAPDVRRQRHLAVAGERVLRTEGADEADAPQAAAQDFENLHGAVVPKHDAPARLELAARVPHSGPRAVLEFTHEKELALTTASSVLRFP